MDPRFPGYDPRYYGQNGGPPPSHATPMGYGFDGLIPMDQQQQQAYLASLQNPSQHNQQFPTQYYPHQQYSHHEPQRHLHAQSSGYYATPQYPQYPQHSPQQQQFQAQQQPPQYYNPQPHFSQRQGNIQHQSQQQPRPSSGHSAQTGQLQYTHNGQMPIQNGDIPSHPQAQHLPSQQNSGPRALQQQQQQQQQQQRQRPKVVNHSEAKPAQSQHIQRARMQAQPNVKQASLDGAADYANKPVFSEQPQQARKANQAAPVVKVTVVSEQATTPVVTTEFPVDYRLLLLSLADEYISQARLSSHVVASSIDQSEGNQYFKLIATGLACYESVLKTPHWQSSPRQEAMIRLRYATVLHEETENDRVVEDVLAKGLLLCERNRLFDLKYSMQHLLARVICNTKPKAALKHVEKAVEEAKASRHVPWIYALQFLRASLLVQQNGQDVKQALASLQSVAELARSQRDAGVCAMALIREAMLHMSLRAHDWDKEVDRVLASARAQHMNLGDQAAPQIGALIHLLNLASSFEPCQPKQLEQKRLAMLDYYDNHIHEADWPVDGIFSLPIRGAEANKLTSDTCGIFVADENGKTQLRFRWLDKQDTFALAYTLNAMVAHSKPSSQEKSRPEELLKEALKYTSISSAPREARIPLAAACEHVRMRNVLQCYVLINLAFLYCNRSNLAEASSTMASLKKLLKCPGLAAPGNVATMLTYLEAMIMHAKGKVVDALQVYQSPRLSLLEGSFGIATVKEQLRVLAALSVILIVRSPAHPSHALLRPLLDRLTPVFEGIKSTSDACERGMSPQLAAAYSLVLATSHEDRWSLQEDAHTSVLSTKKHLQVCFHVAKDMTNHLLLAAGMSFLHSQMFNGQVGDQALNSARNAQDLAKNSGSVLWACVTDGIAATAMEKNGMGEQAQKALEHGIKLAERLPGGVMDLLDAQQGE